MNRDHEGTRKDWAREENGPEVREDYAYYHYDHNKDRGLPNKEALSKLKQSMARLRELLGDCK